MDNEDLVPARPTHRPPLPTGVKVAVGVLLAVPVIALLLVPTYSRQKPYLLGFPFFYWYQLLWMFLEALMVYVAYRLVVRARGEKQ